MDEGGLDLPQDVVLCTERLTDKRRSRFPPDWTPTKADFEPKSLEKGQYMYVPYPIKSLISYFSILFSIKLQAAGILEDNCQGLKIVRKINTELAGK